MSKSPAQPSNGGSTSQSPKRSAQATARSERLGHYFNEFTNIFEENQHLLEGSPEKNPKGDLYTHTGEKRAEDLLDETHIPTRLFDTLEGLADVTSEASQMLSQVTDRECRKVLKRLALLYPDLVIQHSRSVVNSRETIVEETSSSNSNTNANNNNNNNNNNATTVATTSVHDPTGNGSAYNPVDLTAEPQRIVEDLIIMGQIRGQTLGNILLHLGFTSFGDLLESMHPASVFNNNVAPMFFQHSCIREKSISYQIDAKLKQWQCQDRMRAQSFNKSKVGQLFGFEAIADESDIDKIQHASKKALRKL